jgi:hypothetical protein
VIFHFVLIAGICVLYEKGLSFRFNANSVGVPAGFQYCAAMIQQYLCNNSASTLQQLGNSPAIRLQRSCNNTATIQQ